MYKLTFCTFILDKTRFKILSRVRNRLDFWFSYGTRCGAIKIALRQVLDITNKALSAWTVGQNLVTRVTKLTSDRSDKIDRLINFTRLSIIKENKKMQNLNVEGYTTQRLLLVVVEQVKEIITHLQEIECMYLAMKDLSVGQLSHYIIETRMLQDNLNILGKLIKNTILRLDRFIYTCIIITRRQTSQVLFISTWTSTEWSSF